jgi:enterobacterial common antigen flippase
MYDIIKKSFATTILSVVTLFLFNVVISRVLGPSSRGEFGQINLLANLIYAFSNLGLHDSYIYYRRKLYCDTGASSLFFINYIFSFILFFIYYFFFSGDNNLSNSHYFFMFLFVNVTYFVTTHILLIDSKLDTFNLSKIARPLLLLSGVCLMYIIYGTISVDDVIITHIIVYLIIAVFCIIKLVRSEVVGRSFFVKVNWNDYLSYSFKSYGVAIFSVFVSNFDKVFLFFRGQSYEFGVYIVAYSTSRLITLLPNTLSTVIFSNFAGKGEDGLKDISNLSFSILFMPMVFLAFIIWLASGFVLIPIFGEEYREMVLPFNILVLEAVVSAMGWILAQRFLASGRPGLVLTRQIISLTPLIALFFWDISISITTALAISVLISSVIRLLITFYIYKAHLKENIPCVNFSIKKIIMILNKEKI